jgi:hypothetical protein
MVKKKTGERGSGEVKANPIPYRVDGEIGRFRFTTYRLEVEGEVSFDSGRELFPALKGEQWYLSLGFKEIGLFYGTTRRPYRETAEMINRVRRVEDKTPMRSLREQSEREGAELQAHIEERCEQILTAQGLSVDQEKEVKEGRWGPKQVRRKRRSEVDRAIKECRAEAEAREEMRANPIRYEEPSQSVRLSVDDVGVKRQKAKRVKAGEIEAESAEKKGLENEEKKSVRTTVAHLETEEGRYVLSGLGMESLLRQVLAFLLANRLTGRHLIVFVDGQRSLHQALARVLRVIRNWQVILDWYHLEKRCREDLSLALKGRAIRNQVLEGLMALLWDGRVSSALTYLAQLKPSQIKSAKDLERLKDYLERQRPHIPCYSVRKKLGLCNSSNRVEKANDLVVARRQKHDGMSWSPSGSIALAALATAARNNEIHRWFRTGDIKFELAA